MCGIVGYIGKNVKHNLINSLKKLEYRGYDSSGIAWKENNNIELIKKQGYIQNLEDNLDFNTDLTSLGIAHTRWATHGDATDFNAHPHLSMNKMFALVHNGIIENFLELKQFLIENNYTFLSETDSEVIVNLLEYEYIKSGDILTSLNNCTKKLKGSFALAILSKFDDKIYLAKREMPLYIDAKNKFIASDINAFIKKTDEIYSVENNEFAILSEVGLKFYKNLNEISKTKLKISSFSEENSLKDYPHYMLKEIEEIEEKIDKTIKNFQKNDKLTKVLENIDKIYLIACGTAYHACLNGEKFLIKYAKINATSFVASEFFLSPPIIDNKTLCIFVSQSGETADTINCLKLVKKFHAKTMVITNVKTSSITRLTNIKFFTEAGPEIAVASTKAYNTQVALLYKIVELITKQNNKKIKRLLSLNQLQIGEIYRSKREFYDVANKLLKFDKVFFIGRNFDYITSLEAALKLKEITYINCQAMPAGELKHGTLALIDNTSVAIAIITEKDKLEKTLNNVNEILSRNGNVIIVSPFADEVKKKLKSNKNISYLTLPKIHKNFYPLISVIPMQYLAYYVSVLKGLNPDKPRNLAKSVTVE